MKTGKKEITTPELLDFACEIAKHDTRIERCRIHEGRTIAFIALCAVLSGYRTWDEIHVYAECRKPLMEEYLGELESVPSADTFNRFFSLLRPESFEGVYREWIRDVFRLRAVREGKVSSGEIIAVDGKELRGASSASGTPLRMVSAYAVNAGLSLGQVEVGEKSNEIPAVQELVSELDIKGCTVTADAMHCQRKTCKAIVDNGGDFFLFVKENQKSLLQKVKRSVSDAMSHPRNNNDACGNLDESRKGNAACRRCVAVGEKYYLGTLLEKWPYVKSFGVIVSERAENGRMVKEERYFITSLKMDARRFVEISRMHWGIENGLHRRLDVDFMEDSSRKRKNAAINFSLVNKIAMTVLGMETSKKEAWVRKKQRAALDDGYMRKLLSILHNEL